MSNIPIHYALGLLLFIGIMHLHGMMWPEVNRYDIDVDQYNAIKAAVFMKKGFEYMVKFQTSYSIPCVEGVIALSQEFDDTCYFTAYGDPISKGCVYIKDAVLVITGGICTVLYASQDSTT